MYSSVTTLRFHQRDGDRSSAGCDEVVRSPNPTFQGNFLGRLTTGRSAPAAPMLFPVPLVLGCDPQLEVAPSSPLGPSHAPGTSLAGDPGDPFARFRPGSRHGVDDAAEVVLRVLARGDGSPQAVQTLQEPGSASVRHATRCAMGRRYTPGHDGRGLPVAAWTPPLIALHPNWIQAADDASDCLLEVASPDS